ncbi:flagellar hook-length control protein FliK [Halomonas sp. MCCC 1A17488]|uniref:flagellar hook-length control protein FliK n=1 Tax=unclassified Halomonas TaxID=2609666 RepID=UPI0018D249B8|nr:flagellar hook-length control protein FliK [Halomonas sp. SS10-MC5]MCE8014857.1 flagellar hook-length control protein FliK [Halomonas sp. MCCC 1A17488]MCG3238190.1 flagellar hook-length control protein FliK [Halomonas sp. MCCC 1A17488]QPP48044.1 flagellar hook-length control protein FliK [Halomonas sp. SS10-MC5]
MSGITPLLDTLLHQVLGKRIDTAPPRELTEPVRPVDPGEGPRALHSDSRLEGRRPGMAPLQGTATPNQRGEVPVSRSDPAPSPASFQTHFSPSARTIADLLVRFPAPPSVLSPNSPLMTSGEAPSASILAERLQTGVRDSGLFYEAHLSRWYRGEMSRQQLEREPQMLRTLRFTPAAPANAPAPAPVAGAGAPATGQPGLLQPAPPAPGQALPGQAPSAASAYVATESLYPAAARGERAGGEMPAPSQAPARDTPAPAASRVAGAELAGQAEGEPPARARATGGEPVHESLQGLVRHQLEMLVTPVLRWEGDVWSGIFMALMIQLPAGARHEHEGTEQGQGEGQQEAWHSELQLTVPSLGEIRVALWLQETHLRLQLLAREEGSLSVLKRGLPQLEQRLEEAGLSPVLIDAGPWEGGAMDGGGADDGAEA